VIAPDMVSLLVIIADEAEFPGLVCRADRHGLAKAS
jgi:hypothetical protein